jgi:hypothetical protein
MIGLEEVVMSCCSQDDNSWQKNAALPSHSGSALRCVVRLAAVLENNPILQWANNTAPNPLKRLSARYQNQEA